MSVLEDNSHPDIHFRELRTARLAIRRFTPRDAATFAAYRSDPEVAKYQSWDPPVPVEDAARFIAGLGNAHPDAPGEWFQFAIDESATGTHIGDLAVLCDLDDPRLATLGFTIASSAQRRGYATEAVTAMLEYLFVHRGKHRVAADCDVRNVASVRLLERVGMRREAHHVRSAWWKGEWTDEYVYAVLASEWRPAATEGLRVTDLPPNLNAAALKLWDETALTRPWNDAHADLQLALRGDDSTVLACLDNDRLIGTAMVGHDGHRGWIYYMAVRPDEQGKSYGRRLLQACEEWVGARGIPKVQLMVRDDNENVISFYERLGFERSAVVVLGRRLDETPDR